MPLLVNLFTFSHPLEETKCLLIYVNHKKDNFYLPKCRKKSRNSIYHYKYKDLRIQFKYNHKDINATKMYI